MGEEEGRREKKDGGKGKGSVWGGASGRGGGRAEREGSASTVNSNHVWVSAFEVLA
jgi:hypothetical protein